MAGSRLTRGPKILLKSAAHRLGYSIVREDLERIGTMEALLARLARLVGIRTVVDVGASDGRWSLMAQRHLPDARYLLIEAQEGPHGAALRRLVDDRSAFHVVFAAAGDTVGEVHFDAADPWSGVASATPTGEHDLVVTQTTIDTEVSRLELPAPYLIKLDTHGYEVPILDGARATLARSSALVIEAYNFRLRPGALRFHQLISHLEALGFRPVDLVDPMWRPRDGALWQFDLAFVREDSPVFQIDSYE